MPHPSRTYFDLKQPHNLPIKKVGKGKRPKLVPCEDIIEPESGIHVSLSTIQNIHKPY